MKRLHLLIVMMLTATVIYAQQQQQQQHQQRQRLCDSAVINVDTAAFKIMLDRGDGTILDVRTPEEFKTGYIDGAINIDFLSAGFQEEIKTLDKTKTYYVYCESGRRSAKAAAYMKEQGFCRVVALNGGMIQWRDAGYSMVVPK